MLRRARSFGVAPLRFSEFQLFTRSTLDFEPKVEDLILTTDSLNPIHARK